MDGIEPLFCDDIDTVEETLGEDAPMAALGGLVFKDNLALAPVEAVVKKSSS